VIWQVFTDFCSGFPEWDCEEGLGYMKFCGVGQKARDVREHIQAVSKLFQIPFFSIA
jgi:hypothetical protein